MVFIKRQLERRRELYKVCTICGEHPMYLKVVLFLSSLALSAANSFQTSPSCSVTLPTMLKVQRPESSSAPDVARPSSSNIISRLVYLSSEHYHAHLNAVFQNAALSFAGTRAYSHWRETIRMQALWQKIFTLGVLLLAHHQQEVSPDRQEAQRWQWGPRVPGAPSWPPQGPS